MFHESVKDKSVPNPYFLLKAQRLLTGALYVPLL